MNSTWEKKKLNEVVWFQEGPGVRKHQYTTKGIKLLNVRNLVKGSLILDNTEVYISNEEGNGRYKHFLVDEGDLIIGSSGIKVEKFEEKVAFVEKRHLPLCMNTSTIRFKTLNDNILNIKFFSYYLKSRFFKEQIQFHITGSAQLNFGPSHLNKMTISLPPLEYQQRIVKILDKAEEIRTKKKLANEKLDEFLKSTFIDMFGDPVTNPKNWSVSIIKEVAEKDKNAIKAGPFGSALKKEYYTDSGYKIYGQEQVISGDINYGDYYIDEKIFNKLRNCEIKENDVLISLVGSYGRILIVPKEFQKGIINPRLMKITFDKSKISTLFFKYFFSNESLQKLLCDNTHGGTMGILNTSIVKALKIIVPPIDLQKQFAQIVQKVEAQKEKNQKVIEQMDNLFNSLMQQVFNSSL